MLFYVVRHLDSIASFLNIGLHLGFFRLWPSLYPPFSFSSAHIYIYIWHKTVVASFKILCQMNDGQWTPTCSEQTFKGGT
jgi:hypothetical protein